MYGYRWRCGWHMNDSFVEAVLEACHPDNIANYLYMSFTELDHVTHLDHKMVIILNSLRLSLQQAAVPPNDKKIACCGYTDTAGTDE